MEKLHNLPILREGESFSNWRFRLEMILRERELHNTISVKYRKEDDKEFAQKDMRAKCAIVQCLDDKYLETVKNCESALDMLTALENLLERKSIINKLHLRRKLINLKCPSGTKLQDFFMKFDGIIGDLNGIGTIIDEEEQVCYLLAAMPPEYDAIITSIETMSTNTSLGIDFIKSRLLDTEIKFADKEVTPEQAFSCYTCGKKGHKSYECPTTKDKDNYRGNRGRGTRGRSWQRRPRMRGRGRATCAVNTEEKEEKEQWAFTAFGANEGNYDMQDVTMVSCKDDVTAQIPQFYAGRSIFITGATGFMGKVLVERLLTTCPDVDRLFLLMRTKRDVGPEKRLQQLKESQVFDNVRQCSPAQLDKLCIVPGDITKPQLGMTGESIAQLRNVSVVFHSAATLKFDEALGLAVDQNVRSVVRLMELCDMLPNMQAFVYVSTGYSNAELSVVEERVYPPPAPLEQVLALTEAMPEDLMASVTKKYIHPKPNTYTFTKAIAEVAVQQHNSSYPRAIFRPTIVVSALRTPFPGWVENLNGPTGVIAGVGKGLLHFFSCRRDARADMIPVDIVIDALLAVGWETAVDRSSEVRVYNCSSYNNPTTWRTFEAALSRYIREHPMDQVFWYPYGSIVENGVAQKCLELLLQTMPLHLADYCSRIFGIKTKLSFIMVSNRLQAMNTVLQFFSQREWKFITNNMERLRQRLTPADAAIFNLDVKTINWEELCANFIKGTKKYIFKEKDENIPEAKKHLQRMKLLHHGVIFFTLTLLLRLTFKNALIYEFVRGVVRFMFTLYCYMTAKVKAS